MSWFTGLFARSRPAAPRSRRPSCRLRLEALEDRVVPTVGDILWTQQFGTSGTETAPAAAADGSVYVVGSTSDELPGQTSVGNNDAYVRKYDASGTEVWTRQFGTTGVEVATGIVVDATGVYVVGFTGSTFPGQTSSGGNDVFVRKYDADGVEVWTRQFGTASSDISGGIALHGGALYVGGRTPGAFPSQTNAGLTDPFVRKYDLDGTELWTRQFGSAGNDTVPTLAADASGVYLSGLVGAALPGQTYGGGFSDVYVRKYDASGVEVWTREFGGSLFIGANAATGIGVNASGVYVSGSTPGALPGQTGAGLADAFVRKYDAGGTEVWTRQFGSAGDDTGRGIAVDAGGVYVAGTTAAALPGQTSAGGSDAYVRRYDNAGTEVWTRQFGSAANETTDVGVAVDASGVYVAGSTFGALPGQTSAGGQDAYVVKLDTGAAPNAPPVNTVPGGTVTATEGVATAITGISVSDPDAGGAVIQTTLTVDHGSLAVATDVPGGLAAGDVGGNGTAAVVLTGTIAQINATLAASGGLTYVSNSGYNGADTLTVSTSDLGNTGTGGPQTDVDQVSINVLPAFGVTLTPGGQLVITGTDQTDLIFVTRRNSTVRVDVWFGGSDDGNHDEDCHENDGRFQHFTFAAASVTSVSIDARGGNDLVVIGCQVSVPVSTSGGAGNDLILDAGSGDNSVTDSGGNNVILAVGSGDHTITTGGGNDWIVTDGGDDVIDAGDGSNYVSAGSGDDVVTTGSGADVVKAGNGNDLVFAGGGNDLVDGGGGNDVLVGGAGDDLLLGGDGRDVIIGGFGADRISGNASDDLLIAGSTCHDGDATALAAIMAEWSSAGSYAARVANLKAGTGLASGYRLNGDDGAGQTVFNDSSVDVLAGNQGSDWFLANRSSDNGGPLDVVSDRTASELWSDTDF